MILFCDVYDFGADLVIIEIFLISFQIFSININKFIMKSEFFNKFDKNKWRIDNRKMNKNYIERIKDWLIRLKTLIEIFIKFDIMSNIHDFLDENIPSFFSR